MLGHGLKTSFIFSLSWLLLEWVLSEFPWDFAPLKCKILWYRDVLNRIQTFGVLASGSFVKCWCGSSASHYIFWIWLSPMTIYSEGVFSNKSWSKRFVFSHWHKKAKPFGVVVLSSVIYLKNSTNCLKGRPLPSPASTGYLAGLWN